MPGASVKICSRAQDNGERRSGELRDEGMKEDDGREEGGGQEAGNLEGKVAGLMPLVIQEGFGKSTPEEIRRKKKEKQVFLRHTCLSYAASGKETSASDEGGKKQTETSA